MTVDGGARQLLEARLSLLRTIHTYAYSPPLRRTVGREIYEATGRRKAYGPTRQ